MVIAIYKGRYSIDKFINIKVTENYKGRKKMIIGVPKEIKNNEYRVAATPDCVAELIKRRNVVLVEKDAGIGSGYSDEDYRQAGAQIVDAQEAYNAELVYKVKEILPEEYKYLREGQIIFTYIHSNAHVDMTTELLKAKVVGISYEDITDDNGEFPLLKPMSILAGKGGFLAALHFGQKVNGGNGVLFNRCVGVSTPVVTIIGAGNAGMGAAELASAFGCKVNILDLSLEKLEKAKDSFSENVQLLFSNRTNLEKCLRETDVLINCILWPKTRKDHLVNKEDLALMKKGSIIVDVSCDDEGCIETSHSTTHKDPIYFVNGIMHYVVDNIPSAFSQTASICLSNATMPFLLEIATKGYKQALIENTHLRKGLSFHLGKLTLEETALKQNREYTSPDNIIKSFIK